MRVVKHWNRVPETVAEVLNLSWSRSWAACPSGPVLGWGTLSPSSAEHIPTSLNAGSSLSLGVDQLLLWFWALQAVVQTPTMMIIKPVLSNDFTTSLFYSVVFPCYLNTDACDFFSWSITLSVLTSSYSVFLFTKVCLDRSGKYKS